MQRTLRARVVGSVSALALVAGLTVALTASSAVADTASDPRATFSDGNVTTCEDVGLGDSIQLPDPTSNVSANDGAVKADVETNSGPIHTGQGQEVNVTIIDTNVVIDAVVVKGGNGYNVYDDPSVLPPALQPKQHYISPFNNGGQVPAISHYFVCYHLEEGPTTGNLAVHKDVVQPVSGAVVPTSFNVHVDCDSGDFDLVLVDGQTEEITGLPIGDICVVTEDESSFPLLSVVTYDPATANTAGVEIGDGTTVTVNILNDFGAVEATKVVEPAAPVAASPAFTG